MPYKIKYSNELKHHGILGMKWGKRNGPPYPLDYEDHSTEQKRLNPKSRLNNYDNNNVKNENQKEAKSEGFKLTDKQKTYIKVGLAATATILAAYGVYKISKTLNYKDFEIKDIFIVDPQNKINKNPDLTGKIKESLLNVNPSNESDHCQQNSLASALKYMGFDVQTKEGQWSTSAGSIVDKCFKGSFETKVKEPNLIFDTSQKAEEWIIKRMKPEEGSCGTISCKLKTGSDGHAIRWVFENGKILFSDPWARTKNGPITVEDASFYFGNYFTGEHPVVSRIDNLEINYEEFYKYFKNS